MLELTELETVLETISFAARAHDGHKRKDHRTPYIAHPFRVCFILQNVFGVGGDVLLAALLHDTIEDTRTDYDDLLKVVSPEVADQVATLSKDTRKIEDVREREYQASLVSSPAPIKIAKFADILDNLLDCKHLPDKSRASFLEEAQFMVDALIEAGIAEDEGDKYALPFERACEVVQNVLRRLRQT